MIGTKIKLECSATESISYGSARISTVFWKMSVDIFSCLIEPCYSVRLCNVIWIPETSYTWNSLFVVQDLECRTATSSVIRSDYECWSDKMKQRDTDMSPLHQMFIPGFLNLSLNIAIHQLNSVITYVCVISHSYRKVGPCTTWTITWPRAMQRWKDRLQINRQLFMRYNQKVQHNSKIRRVSRSPWTRSLHRPVGMMMQAK